MQSLILLLTLWHDLCILLLLLIRVNQAPKDDVEDDNLEAMTRGKRQNAAEMTSPGDPDDIKSFNPEIKTNHYESKGTYVCELVGEQRRLLRRRRSDDVIGLGEHVENSLLAFINKSKSISTIKLHQH